MFTPSIFNDRAMDNLFDGIFGMPVFEMSKTAEVMKTDVEEKDGEYHMEIELPGYRKEDIKAELTEGYLTISARKDASNEKKDKKGNVIFHERHSGECSRSFFVGKHVTEEDIKANFDNGTLTLEFPTEEKKPAIPEKKYIAIA